MDAANTALVDFCRAFWSWLDKQRSAENVFSIERVGGELRAGTNDLASWVEKRVRTSFSDQRKHRSEPPGNEPVVHQRFVRSGGGQHAPPSGDYYLVAHAHAKAFTVVTHEIAANSTKKIKIPDACNPLGIKCVTPYAMLRSESLACLRATSRTVIAELLRPRFRVR